MECTNGRTTGNTEYFLECTSCGHLNSRWTGYSPEILDVFSGCCKDILINSITKKLTLDISPTEYKKRISVWKQPKLKRKSGVLSKYAKLVSQADLGAITVD